jgi:transcriptional regulator of arginine metabolism
MSNVGCMPHALPVHEQRALPKADRHKLIASVVTRKRIGTQRELVEALAAAGCRVTQATASRDIRELGLGSLRDEFGVRYVVPGRERRVDPRGTLNGLLAQFGRRAVAAGNIVVVQSEIGSAPAIARAIDRLKHPQVVGTLAGDDTCLVISLDQRRARALARELSASMRD